MRASSILFQDVFRFQKNEKDPWKTNRGSFPHIILTDGSDAVHPEWNSGRKKCCTRQLRVPHKQPPKPSKSALFCFSRRIPPIQFHLLQPERIQNDRYRAERHGGAGEPRG